jgi:hypothetical protein
MSSHDQQPTLLQHPLLTRTILTNREYWRVASEAGEQGPLSMFTLELPNDRYEKKGSWFIREFEAN